MNEFINKIHLGDCIEVMRQLPDKSVDLVLTDPPYGTSNKIDSCFGVNLTKKKRGTFAWNGAIPSDEIFHEIFRVSKNQIIFGGNYFTKILPPTNSWIVWDKIGNLNLMNPFSDCELAWTSFKSPVRKITCIQQGFIRQDKSERIHPTQKPLPLFIEIVSHYSKEGELILDPFSGSGTTAVACAELGRNFICIEKEPEYYEASVRRLKEATAQEMLPL